MARRFADAFMAADVDGLVSMLSDNAWLSMPPEPQLYLGPVSIAEFFRSAFAGRGERRTLLCPTRANAQPAFGIYFAEPGMAEAKPGGLLVLTIAGGRLHGIARFHVEDRYPLFGLPEVLPVPGH